MKELAPIVIFVYARPEHTKNMINALAQNNLAKDSKVYIFADNAKKESHKENVEKVRKFIHEIPSKNMFKEVIITEADKNKGLANSVIDGVSKIINKYGKVIVLEDDLVVSKTFLQYMNESLEFYKDNKKIWSISGYNLPIEIPQGYEKDVYLSYRGCSWGWATWKDRWNTVDWKVTDYNEFKHSIKKRKKMNRGGTDMAQMLDAQMKGLCDSWAIRWCYEQSKKDMMTIYPVKSLVTNQGLDGTGTHSGTTSSFDVKNYSELPKLENELEVNKKIIKEFRKKFYTGRNQILSEILITFRLEKLLEVARKVKNGK